MNEEGKWVVSLYKRRLPYDAPDDRPKSEIIPLGGRRGGLRRGLYGGSELTICGLSGNRVNPAFGEGSVSWRCEE